MPTILEEKPDCLLGEIRFQKTIQTRQFEPAVFSHTVSYLIDADGSAEDNLSRAREAATECKALVYEQMGVTAEFNDHILMEILDQAMGPTEDVTTQSTAPAATSSDAPPYDPNLLRKPRRDMNDIEKAQARSNTEWAEARLSTHPQEFFDNRESKTKSSQPDYKHKSSGIGIWLD